MGKLHFTQKRRFRCHICKLPIIDEGNHDIRRHDQCVEDKLATYKPSAKEIEDACFLIRQQRLEQIEQQTTVEYMTYSPRVARSHMGNERRGGVRE